MLTGISRLCLLLLLALGVFGLLHPELRPMQQSAHVAAVFALTLAIGLSFPKVRLLWIELLLIGVTLTVELAQFLGLMVGLAQAADVVADIIGTVAAVPVLLWIRRRREAK